MSSQLAFPGRSAWRLGLIAALTTALLAGVHALTSEKIAHQAQELESRRLQQVLPESLYNNNPRDDLLLVKDEAHFKHSAVVRIYRARDDGQPVGLVLRHTATDGYNGEIVLLTGILANGRISGVRVVHHKETPGLGDPIELSRSTWILGFSGRSLEDPVADHWGVQRDGGAFDQFTGATITPRAVVRAVQRALAYYQIHGDALFAETTGNGAGQ